MDRSVTVNDRAYIPSSNTQFPEESTTSQTAPQSDSHFCRSWSTQRQAYL